MIANPLRVEQQAEWHRVLASAVRDPHELLRLLDLPCDALPLGAMAHQQFPLRVPRGYIARMRRGDAQDPLLRQVWPLVDEQKLAPGFTTDPVGDLAAHAAPGVLHKYHGRALLITTGACAIHCRYCFRRHFPYAQAQAASQDWRAALEYIAADPHISEVILSGGDPLSLADHKLSALAQRLAEIPHVRRLRLHTRLPIVLPERIDEHLLRWLASSRLIPVMVIHANHAQEIDETVAVALRRVQAAGVRLLNQTVLLKGINDDVSTLAALSEALFEVGVIPYYVHLLDRVQGAAHFEVPLAQAQHLMAGLRACLPGYLVPRLVREDPGAAHKTWLGGG